MALSSSLELMPRRPTTWPEASMKMVDGTLSRPSGARSSASGVATGSLSFSVSTATRTRRASASSETARKRTGVPAISAATLSSSGNSRAQARQVGSQKFTTQGDPRISWPLRCSPESLCTAKLAGSGKLTGRSRQPTNERHTAARKGRRRRIEGTAKRLSQRTGQWQGREPLPSVNLDQRPPVPPQRLAWIALAACFAATLGGASIGRLSPAVGLWFTEIFCILGVAWAVTRWSGRAPAAYVRLTWPGLPAVAFAAALSVANFLGLAMPINAASEHFAPQWLKEAFDTTRILEQFSGGEMWIFAAAAVVAAPLCEEFVFRGLLQQGLAAKGVHPVEAIFFSALLFALFHLNPVELLALLELGLLFGFLYQRTGSLLPGMVAHATQNATSLAIYFIGRRAALPEATEEISFRQVAALSGMGITILAMLFLLGRHFPKVWGRPVPASFEHPRVSLSRALAPWLLAACFSLLGWFLVDRRGLEVGLVDVQVELPEARADEGADVGAARAELQALRKLVRAGRLPLQKYMDDRRALAARLERAHPTPPAGKDAH